MLILLYEYIFLNFVNSLELVFSAYFLQKNPDFDVLFIIEI